MTAWYMATMTLTLLVSGAALTWRTEEGLTNWLDAILLDRAHRVAESLQADDEVLTLPRHEAYHGPQDGVFVLAGDCRVLAARNIEPEPFLGSEAVARARADREGRQTVSTPAGPWRVVTCPGPGGRVVAVTHGLREQGQVLQRMLEAMEAILPLALLAIGAGGWLLSGRLLRPLSAMATAARSISEQDLSRRLQGESPDELGRLAVAINGLLGRLEQAFQRERRFTADAAHELRTPVATIRALSSQKLQQDRSAAEYRAALERIDGVAEHMGRMVAHLLHLARGGAAAELERTPLDLRELAAEVAAQLSETTGRAIALHGDESVPLTGDVTRLTQLLLNLVDNALQHTPANTAVTLEVRRAGTGARLEVRDQGPGVAAEHLGHLGEPFYRVDPARSRQTGGFGLGLAISRQIVAGHGGSFQVRSTPGQGLAVEVQLP